MRKSMPTAMTTISFAFVTHLEMLLLVVIPETALTIEIF
jgi:hypothetical protein